MELRLPNGALSTVGTAYLPPYTNLGRRRLTESDVRQACEEILYKIHAESPLLLCGDFNARTGSRVPAVTDPPHPPRQSSDSVICARGEWLLSTCATLSLRMLNG